MSRDNCRALQARLDSTAELLYVILIRARDRGQGIPISEQKMKVFNNAVKLIFGNLVFSLFFQ